MGGPTNSMNCTVLTDVDDERWAMRMGYGFAISNESNNSITVCACTDFNPVFTTTFICKLFLIEIDWSRHVSRAERGRIASVKYTQLNNRCHQFFFGSMAQNL